MGFIFRTVFWLALAIVILPPEARLGGGRTADFSDVDPNAVLGEAAESASAIGDAVLNTCESNPGLCAAGQNLLDTVGGTVETIAADLEERWQHHNGAPQKMASLEPRHKEKIQARVE